MKSGIKKFMAAGLMALTALGFTASCEKGQSNAEESVYASVLDVSADGISLVNMDNLKSALISTSPLTADEQVLLIKMKNDEKLARDVYSFLLSKWGSQVFSNIAEAETNHLNAVIRLMTFYGLSGTEIEVAGTFTDPAFQSLYNDLTAKGSANTGEAYKVGALIEELDIKDLRDALAVVTNENVKMVFENLERGSENHLRAFYRQLSALGIVYTPVYLTAAEYDQIVSTPVEKGKQYRMRAGQHQGDGMRKMRRGNNQ